MNAPSLVSVVVATHDRSASLARLLDALALQVGTDPPFEVVIVDDWSSDSTPEVLARRPPEDTFSIRVLRLNANRGPAVARNVGWRAASAPLVCFTDDDCQPDPEWLGAMCRRLADDPVVQGRTVPDPAQVHRWGPWSHTVEVLEEGGFYETCNMGYRREVLERLGGFDEAFRRPYGEDADLGWRARDAGFATCFADEAVVYHDVSSSSWKAYVRDLARREALVRVAASHPGVRDCFPAPWYTRKTHPTALALAVSLVLVAIRPRRRPSWLLTGGAICLYYEAVRTTRKGPPRRSHWPLVLPMAFVADLVEVSVLARASWRHRTFLI